MAVPLNIPEGVTVHVQGDLVLHQGVTGKGTLVVDGNAVIRGSSGLLTDNASGVLLYVDGDAVIANPAATFDGTQWNTPRIPSGTSLPRCPTRHPVYSGSTPALRRA